MSLENSVANKLSRLFERKTSKTAPYDTQAVVKRVEGKTAWVHIPGGVDETPVRIGVDVKPGDSVMVRVSGGKAWILGNETTPPSNDKKAVAEKMSKNMADRAKDIVIDFGSIFFKGNTLRVDSKNFKLDKNGNAKFSGELEGAGGTFKGTVRGAKYVDSTGDFFMDIGATAQQSGQNTPAFKIGGYINGDPNNDYLEIEISLYLVGGSVIPHMYIAGTVKDNPDSAEEHSASMGFDDTGIHFYGSWIENGHLTRVHSSIPWGVNV